MAAPILNSTHNKTIKLLTIMAPVFYLGIGNKYPWLLLGANGVSIGVCVFFLTTLLFLMLAFIPKIKINSMNLLIKTFHINLFLSMVVSLIYTFLQYKHFLRFGYNRPTLLYLLILLGMVLLTLNLNTVKKVFIICCIYNILHLLISIHYFPLTTQRSDMFAAINLSLHQYTLGISPYYKGVSTIGIPPYLPVTILSFVPGYLLGLDLRFIGLTYWLVTLALILIKFDSLTAIQKFAICLLIVNPYFLMRHDLYFQFFLLEITILCLYFHNFHSLFKIIFLGIFLATLQFAWIIFPFIVMYYFPKKNNALLAVGFSLLCGMGISLCYVHNGIHDFLNAIFLHKEYDKPYSTDITFGLSTIFYFAKNQFPIYLVQIISCVAMVIYALYKYIKEHNSLIFKTDYLSLGMLCYLIFMVTNYFIETYLLFPMLLFIILSYKT